jgi:uncharacterized protein YpuA (DUF1002 family)
MKMKKKVVLAAVLAGAVGVATISPTFVKADGQRVVTLGVDLSDAQKQAILNYFNVTDRDDVQYITVNNQQERDLLGDHIPLEQIGTHTYSCAYVMPTNEGGISVKTANLNYVTSNMIAMTLSTAGVTNCEVIAASPFEVSGTGALTGVLLAYETATEESLSEDQKDLAVQELVAIENVMGEGADSDEATDLVNSIKIDILEEAANSEDDEDGEDGLDEDTINEIIDNKLNESNISLSDEDKQLLVDLMTKISQQDYDYDAVLETLKKVEENVNNLSSDVADVAEKTDSILNSTGDSSGLGDGVVVTDTNGNTGSNTNVTVNVNVNSGTNGNDSVITDNSGDGVVEETPDTTADTSTASEVNEEGIYIPDADTDTYYVGDDGITEEQQEVADAPTEEVTEASTEPASTTLETTVNIETSPNSANDDYYSGGIDTLYMTVDRKDLTGIGGNLIVYEDDIAIDEISLSGTSALTAVVLPDTDSVIVGIKLTDPLEEESSYRIEVEDGILQFSDGSYATINTGDWTIDTDRHTIVVSGTAEVGSTVEAMIDLKDSAYADVYADDDSIVTIADPTITAENSIAVLNVNKVGRTTVTVEFKDEEGNTEDISYFDVIVTK